MTEELEKGQGLLAAGDIQGLLRHLRVHGEALPLDEMARLVADSAPVLSELVTALESNGQHARAVTVLEEHESTMQWVNRFQYVYNALMAGELEKAADGFGRLPEPEDTAWTPAREKPDFYHRGGVCSAVVM